MLASEIRELSADEIRARITELEEERFRLKFRGATETLEDPLRLRAIRKDVARLQTVLREKAVGAQGAGGTKDARSTGRTSAAGTSARGRRATGAKR